MSSSSSHASSQKRSAESQPPPNTFDSLLPYLLSAKRSLSTVEHVYRANDLCSLTRKALETSVITSSRSKFLNNGAISQLRVLKRVQEETNSSAKGAKAEYQEVLTILDEAEGRLRDTLCQCEKTIIEAQLRPADEAPKSLLDFVDQGGVEGLIKDTRYEVEQPGKGFEELLKQHENFDKEIQKVATKLRAEDDKYDDQNPIPNDDENPLPELLADMEERAKSMAVDLESLVTHFDLCVTAIKHTEGGGDAALQIADDLPQGLEIGQDAEPISDEGREEMLNVLRDDAGQVEEVVMEIKDQVQNMESAFHEVEAHLNQLTKADETVISAVKSLETIGNSLPGHIARSQAFAKRWAEASDSIEARLEQLEDAKRFYDEFLVAYDKLIIEVGRRKSVEVARDKIIREAMGKLEKLRTDDLADRELFKNEQGEVLPGDIWPAVLEPPTRFEFKATEGMIEKIPEISASAIRTAIRRVHGSD